MAASRPRRFLLIAGALLAIAACSAGAAVWWAQRTLFDAHGDASEEGIMFTIERGQSARDIIDRLAEQGLVSNPTLARLFLVYRLDDAPLQAGEYRFYPPLDTPTVLDKIIRGEVVTYPLTIIEGLTLDETARSLADQGFGDYSSFLQAMSDPALVRDLDPEATSLEGYLFPDTYSFPRGTSEAQIVATLIDTFRGHYEREMRPTLGPPETSAVEPEEGTDVVAGLRDLVTLASIIEKEAQLADERPVISAVYRNRLEIGMGLFADPTIIYAKKLDGTWNGNLTRSDLQLDSPYNTYVTAGLPPGPICSPGLASLVAALRPADASYLYFVSRNDGSHVFANTLREHQNNVERWQRRYWREKWAKERREGQSVDSQ